MKRVEESRQAETSAATTASLRRLKSRLARLYFVDTHPRREALKRDINQAVAEWAKREARRTKP